MISFHEFRALWQKAQSYADPDEFVAEVGDSDLMLLIYRMANAPAKDIRAIARMTQPALCRDYGIPINTSNKWDTGVNKPLPWAHVLLAYAVISDMTEVRK